MSRTPEPIDVEVGRRVRERRMHIRMSQEKLGEALGITFQQVQKYEKGSNRIGASRLHAIAGVLGVPVQTFFPENGAPPAEHIVLDAQTMRVAQLFAQIPDRRMRSAIARTVEAATSAEAA